MMPSVRDLISIAPQLILSVVAMAVLLLDAIFPRISKRFLAVFSVAGLAGAAFVAWRQWPKGHVTPTMQGMILPDSFTAYFTLILCLGTALSILMSTEYLERNGEDHGEYYALMLFTTVG